MKATKEWSPDDPHFTAFWSNGAYTRLDHWDGDLEELPGEPEAIERVILMFPDGSGIEFLNNGEA